MRASLRTFMRLLVAQRSTVILSNVLGHSLLETAEIVEGNLPAVKSALQRGRERLRALAVEPEETPAPALEKLETEAADGLCRRWRPTRSNCGCRRRQPRPTSAPSR